MTARRLVLAGALHGRDGLVDRGGAGRLGPLLWRSSLQRALGMRLAARRFAISQRTERQLLGELPAMLDEIDAWIDAGVLNGKALNAADFVIAPSLALLLYRPDVRPQISIRFAQGLVDRVLPEPA
jgi:hypothetical protein